MCQSERQPSNRRRLCPPQNASPTYLPQDAGAQTQLQGASWMSVTRMLRQPR